MVGWWFSGDFNFWLDSQGEFHSLLGECCEESSGAANPRFTVKHEKYENEDDLSFCAGGYLKILGTDFDQSLFGGETPYKIMFGPDICGYDVSVIHLVFNWKGRNLHRTPEIPLEFEERDSKSHIYTLLLKPDNTYKVYIDLREKSSGSLHEFWDFPKITIDDPTDRKPEGWIEKRRIIDPEVKKPVTCRSRWYVFGECAPIVLND